MEPFGHRWMGPRHTTWTHHSRGHTHPGNNQGAWRSQGHHCLWQTLLNMSCSFERSSRASCARANLLIAKPTWGQTHHSKLWQASMVHSPQKPATEIQESHHSQDVRLFGGTTGCRSPCQDRVRLGSSNHLAWWPKGCNCPSWGSRLWVRHSINHTPHLRWTSEGRDYHSFSWPPPCCMHWQDSGGTWTTLGPEGCPGMTRLITYCMQRRTRPINTKPWVWLATHASGHVECSGQIPLQSCWRAFRPTN